MKNQNENKNQKNIQLIKKILVSLIVIIVIGTCISIFIINEKHNSDSKGIESKASTTTIGSGTFVTDADHNNEVEALKSISQQHIVVTGNAKTGSRRKLHCNFEYFLEKGNNHN